VEQNRRPSYESVSYTHFFSIKTSKMYDEEKTASSTNVAGQTGYLHVENGK
jgi:hypothetical protein